MNLKINLDVVMQNFWDIALHSEERDMFLQLLYSSHYSDGNFNDEIIDLYNLHNHITNSEEHNITINQALDYFSDKILCFIKNQFDSSPSKYNEQYYKYLAIKALESSELVHKNLIISLARKNRHAFNICIEMTKELRERQEAIPSELIDLSLDYSCGNITRPRKGDNIAHVEVINIALSVWSLSYFLNMNITKGMSNQIKTKKKKPAFARVAKFYKITENSVKNIWYENKILFSKFSSDGQ